MTAAQARYQGWLLAALSAGAMFSTLAMMLWLKPRPDLDIAIRSGAFWMKFSYTAALAVLSLVIVTRQARAGGDCRQPIGALAAPVVALIVLSGIQLSNPSANAAKLVMGDTWTVCPWAIVLLSLPLMGGIFLTLRRPARPSLAGAAAGLVAGAGAATIYGFHCPETGAPFLLIWYTLGIAICAGLGAILGRGMLRW